MSFRDSDEARHYAERWMTYLQGDLAEDEVVAFERECLEDPQTCEELYRELNVDAALRTVRSASNSTRTSRGGGLRRRLVSLALVGGLGVSGLGIAWWAGSGGAPSLPQEDLRCRPVAPRGSSPGFPDRFLWTRESGAQAYHFELRRGGDPGIYWETTVADTFLFVPADRRPASPAGEWSWRVQPRLGSAGTARPSETASFRING